MKSNRAIEGDGMTVIYYYIDEFCDEVNPCEPDLVSWAQWLSQPDNAWGREEPCLDGTEFIGTVMTMQPDVIATRAVNEWALSGEVPDDAFVAVRFGPGLGWSPEGIIFGGKTELIEFLNDEYWDYGDTNKVNIAIGLNSKRRFKYEAGPPPKLIELGLMQ